MQRDPKGAENGLACFELLRAGKLIQRFPLLSSPSFLQANLFSLVYPSHRQYSLLLISSLVSLSLFLTFPKKNVYALAVTTMRNFYGHEVKCQAHRILTENLMLIYEGQASCSCQK